MSLLPVLFLNYSTQMFHQKDMEDLGNHPHPITIILQKHLPDSLMLSINIKKIVYNLYSYIYNFLNNFKFKK